MWRKLQEDASNGIVFTFLFALGIVLVTLFARNAHVGVELILGNVDMLHKKDLPVTYGVTILLVGGVLFGVNYESYLSSSSNKSLWKMISDIQVALGKEATEMPEISFKKVQGNLNIPTGGDGKLVLDGDLSAINPENLTILAETLGGSGKTSNSSGDKSSFTDQNKIF